MIIKFFNKLSRLLIVLLLILTLTSCKKNKDDVDKEPPVYPNIVEAFINNVEDIKTVTLESKDQLDLCILLYNCIDETYVDWLTNDLVISSKSSLDSYITEYNELKETDYNNKKNESLISSFITSVGMLPDIDYISIEDLDKIMIAENNYKALSVDAKNNSEVISAKSILDSIRTEYDAIINLDANSYNAHKFVVNVSKLPAVEELKITDLSIIDSLQALYESLTNEHLNKDDVVAAKGILDTYQSKANELRVSQEKATTFIMAVFSLPTGSGLKYQNAEQRAEINAAFGLYENLNEFEKTIYGVEEAFKELNVVKTQFESLKEPYDISKIKPTHLCLYYYNGPKKLTFESGSDPYTILVNNYGLTKETIKDNVKIYLDVYIEGGAVKGSPLFSFDITEDYSVTVDQIIAKLRELKAAGNEAIKTQGYTFTIHIESLNDQYASSEYSNFFSATNMPIE